MKNIIFLLFLAFLALTGCSAEQDAATEQGNTLRLSRVAVISPISGPSPFSPDGCGQPEIPLYEALPAEIDGANNDGQEFGDESDLSIAVNPRNPAHIVTAWVQDAALGILVAVSFDGGQRWQRVVVPTLTFCQESAEERSLHARLSFGPDDRVYLAIEAVDGLFPDPRQLGSIRIPVSASADGGLTWATTYIDQGIAEGTKGFSTISAEPDRPGSAVVTWHASEPQLATGGTYVSRTTDGGLTWTRTTVRKGAPDDLPFNRVLALADGALLVLSADFSVRAFAAAGLPVPIPPAELRAQRSTDKGQTWSAPLTISDNALGQWPSAAQAPDGSVYVGWTGFDESGVPTQFVARSEDGGQSWLAPIAVAHPDYLQTALAVAGNGVVGFAYTDHRNDVPGDDAVQRDVWLAYSRDRGVSWQETHIAGPFDLGAEDLGFFHETTGLPDGFAAVFLQGAPFALDGRTDVFFARIQVD